MLSTFDHGKQRPLDSVRLCSARNHRAIDPSEDLPGEDLVNGVALTISRYVDDIICDQINNSPIFED